MTTSIYTTSHFNAFKANFDKIAEEIIMSGGDMQKYPELRDYKYSVDDAMMDVEEVSTNPSLCGPDRELTPEGEKQLYAIIHKVAELMTVCEERKAGIAMTFEEFLKNEDAKAFFCQTVQRLAPELDAEDAKPWEDTLHRVCLERRWNDFGSVEENARRYAEDMKAFKQHAKSVRP